MQCVKCMKKMDTVDSREYRNIRYRIYKCPECLNIAGTEERIVGKSDVKYMISRINSTNRTKKRDNINVENE